MAGPWEQYGGSSEEGPWIAYASAEADMRRMADPTSGMSGFEKARAGFGKAFSDIGQGIGQTIGLTSRADVAETRRLDAPLMKSGAAFGGNIAGNVAALVPTAFIPGAATVPGAALIGAGTGAVMPSTSTTETATNIGVGGALGAGTQAVAGMIVKSLQPAASAPATVRDRLFQEASKEGFVAPPSAVSNTFLGRRLESIGGKAAIGQEAAIRNQANFTDKLARRAAGLAPDEDITAATLGAAREKLAKPYREVAALSQRADDALKGWKEANKQSQRWYQAYERLPLPTLQDKAVRFQQTAANLENVIEQEAIAAGRQDLLPALKDARVALAKNFDVQRAVNVGSGEVDASVIGRMVDAAPGRMTGELDLIGRTQQAFKPYMREGGNIPTPGVSKVEALAVPMLAAGGAAASGNVGGMAAGGLPLLSGPTRSFLLSNPVQNALVSPPRPGMLSGLPGVTGNEALIEDILRRYSLPIGASAAAQ